MEAEVGEFGLGRVAQELFFMDPITGVAAELVVPDTGAAAAGIGGRKHGHGGADIPVTGGMPEVMEATLVNLLLGACIPGVQNIEFRPEKAADATNAVSPGEAATIAELRGGQGVGSGFLDGLGDLAKTGKGGSGGSFFSLKKLEKSPGRIGQRKWFFSSGQAETVG